MVMFHPQFVVLLAPGRACSTTYLSPRKDSVFLSFLFFLHMSRVDILVFVLFHFRIVRKCTFYGRVPYFPVGHALWLCHFLCFVPSSWIDSTSGRLQHRWLIN